MGISDQIPAVEAANRRVLVLGLWTAVASVIAIAAAIKMIWF